MKKELVKAQSFARQIKAPLKNLAHFFCPPIKTG